jgi:hypothetical protein
MELSAKGKISGIIEGDASVSSSSDVDIIVFEALRNSFAALPDGVDLTGGGQFTVLSMLRKSLRAMATSNKNIRATLKGRWSLYVMLRKLLRVRRETRMRFHSDFSILRGFRALRQRGGKIARVKGEASISLGRKAARIGGGLSGRRSRRWRLGRGLKGRGRLGLKAAVGLGIGGGCAGKRGISAGLEIGADASAGGKANKKSKSGIKLGLGLGLGLKGNSGAHVNLGLGLGVIGQKTDKRGSKGKDKARADKRLKGKLRIKGKRGLECRRKLGLGASGGVGLDANIKLKTSKGRQLGIGIGADVGVGIGGRVRARGKGRGKGRGLGFGLGAGLGVGLGLGGRGRGRGRGRGGACSGVGGAAIGLEGLIGRVTDFCSKINADIAAANAELEGEGNVKGNVGIGSLGAAKANFKGKTKGSGKSDSKDSDSKDSGKKGSGKKDSANKDSGSKGSGSKDSGSKGGGLFGFLKGKNKGSSRRK